MSAQFRKSRSSLGTTDGLVGLTTEFFHNQLVTIIINTPNTFAHFWIIYPAN